MSNTLIFLLALIGVGILVVVAAMLPGGCTGDCEQGRKPCNCKEEK